MTAFFKLRILAAALLLAASAFSSCTARIDGVVKTGGEAELDVKASLGPVTAANIGKITVFAGGRTDVPVFNGKEISASLAAAPGIRAAALAGSGREGLEGTVSVSRLGDFLASGAANGRFVVYTEGAADSSVVVTLDRETAPLVISALSPEVEEYLSALLAPVVLGESSTKREYLDLIMAVYGRAQAAEIEAARIRASIEFPRPVTLAEGGKAAGNRAEFDIPLVDLLVLEKPLRYEVHWK